MNVSVFLILIPDFSNKSASFGNDLELIQVYDLNCLAKNLNDTVSLEI